MMHGQATCKQDNAYLMNIVRLAIVMPSAEDTLSSNIFQNLGTRLEASTDGRQGWPKSEALLSAAQFHLTLFLHLLLQCLAIDPEVVVAIEGVGEANTMIKEEAVASMDKATPITMTIRAICMRTQEADIMMVVGEVVIRTTLAIREGISTKDEAEVEAEVDTIQGIGEEDVSAWPPR
jgi:hypothetical protein